MTRVSLTGPQFARDFEGLRQWSGFAEANRFDGAFLFDHLIPIGAPNRPVLEMAASLGAMAAATQTLMIGTLVMRAPLRGPELSQAVAETASVIARERLTIGLGAGDRLSHAEAERFGLEAGDLDSRLRQLRTTSELIRDRGSGPDVWIGGTHDRVIEIAAEHADGWNGWMIEPDRLKSIARRLPSDHEISWGGGVIIGRDSADVDRLIEERGTARGAIVGTPDVVAAELRAWIAAGADHLVLSVLPNRFEQWERAIDVRRLLR